MTLALRATLCSLCAFVALAPRFARFLSPFHVELSAVRCLMSSSILPRRLNRRHSSRRGNRLLPSFFAPQLTRESIGPPEPNTQVQHRGWYRVEVLSGWPGAVPGGVEVPAVVDVKMQRQEWIPLDLTATDQVGILFPSYWFGVTA